MSKLYAATTAAALSLILSGCASTDSALTGPSTPNTPAAPSTDYQASGNEPGWRLAISDNQIHYIGDYGETDIRQAIDNKREQAGRTSYDTARLSIVIDHKICSDSMVERQYQDSVSVTADGKTVTGCGGAVIAPTSLNGTSWQIEHISGAAVLPDIATHIAFADGRISGTAGCNRLMGSFTQSADNLAFGSVASTRMACPPAQMEQERSLIAALEQVRRWDFSTDGRLLLRGDAGELVRLRQTF